MTYVNQQHLDNAQATVDSFNSDLVWTVSQATADGAEYVTASYRPNGVLCQNTTAYNVYKYINNYGWNGKYELRTTGRLGQEKLQRIITLHDSLREAIEAATAHK